MKWQLTMNGENVTIQEIGADGSVVDLIAAIPISCPNAEAIAQAIVDAHNEPPPQ